jgi:hypothetical protein
MALPVDGYTNPPTQFLNDQNTTTPPGPSSRPLTALTKVAGKLAPSRNMLASINEWLRQEYVQTERSLGEV